MNKTTNIANSSSLLYIGIMSGTSADGVDLALVDFSNNDIVLVAQHFTPYNEQERDAITSLYLSGNNEIERSQALDISLAKLFANAINQWLEQLNINKQDIIAIGNHGQTIRHRPSNKHAYTLQITCNQTLATLTGIRVIGDFRKKDIAYGGQGAPLVPAFHRALFKQEQHDVCIVNIGGIANISFLPGDINQPIMGFDTGPGNALMDAWCLLHKNQPFDKHGQWAKLGKCSNDLLTLLLSDSYFQLPAPKSTGREYFHLDWLNTYLEQYQRDVTKLNATDVQSTLLHLTVQSIVNDIQSLDNVAKQSPTRVYLCGGGASNPELVSLLQHKLPTCYVETTEQLNIDSNMLEAMAFAWFAYAFDHHITGNIPSATGATKALVLGIPFLP